MCWLLFTAKKKHTHTKTILSQEKVCHLSKHWCLSYWIAANTQLSVQHTFAITPCVKWSSNVLSASDQTISEPKKTVVVVFVFSRCHEYYYFFGKRYHASQQKGYIAYQNVYKKKEKILSALVIDTIDWFSIQAWGIFASALWVLWRRASRHRYPSMT